VTGPAAQASGMEPLSTCDIAGRPDSVQVMLWQGHAFVAHPFTGGFSVVDVRDPRRPRPVAHGPAPPGTLTLCAASGATWPTAGDAGTRYGGAAH
jgi:hypothetical protein